MRSTSDVSDRLTRLWSRQWTAWVAGAGDWPLKVSLSAPSQSEAISNWEHLCQWRQAWTHTKVHLALVNRRWPNLGLQSIPTHAVFPCAADVAAFLGGDRLHRFVSAVERSQTLAERWAGVAIPVKVLPWLADAPQSEFVRACTVVEWLRDHPDNDLYLRQLPIPGVDSKWVESHRETVTTLLGALRGEQTSKNLADALGLRHDKARCRIRLLDPALRASVGGLADITTPVEQLSGLSLGARRAIIVENLQTFLAFDDLPGTVVFFGGGFQALALVAVDWIHRMPVLYWGDIDTAGFEILNGLRAELAHVKSFGMDEETLLRHRHLWVNDPKQRSAVLHHLTAGEASVHRSLLDGRHGLHGIRLEQERLDWKVTWTKLAVEVGCDSNTDGSDAVDD